MALSSGTRSLIGEAASWLIAAGIVVGGLAYFNELRGLRGRPSAFPPRRTKRLWRQAARARERERQARAARSRSAPAKSGHYHTEAEVNGRPVEVMVDTGATMVALTYRGCGARGNPPQVLGFHAQRLDGKRRDPRRSGGDRARQHRRHHGEKRRCERLGAGPPPYDAARHELFEPARARGHALGRPRSRGLGLPPDFGGLWVGTCGA